MTATDNGAIGPVSSTHPHDDAPASEWVAWYWADFLPAWINRARDPKGLGYFDLLEGDGQPQTKRKTVLAQARLLFTFAHVALLSGNPAHIAAAQTAREALPAFRKTNGLYRRALARDGSATDDPADALATSYDQSFLVLSLSTWGKLQPSDATATELDACWSAIERQLIDAKTGMMLEYDGLTNPTAPTAPPRAQNPHMHTYEAALQAYEMTGQPVWLTRAKTMRAKGLEYFFDAKSGTITEFIAPDLSALPGREGQWREIGHQCEWAWLLLREVELGGDPAMRAVADRLLDFADQHGFAQSGLMQGAAFDAVSADLDWREATFLLWPQTEAIKTHAVRSATAGHARKAKSLAQLIFRQYFSGRQGFVNQLDTAGTVLWSDGLSRMHYHIVLALTEGARAGLWENPE